MRHNRDILSIFFNMKVCCVFSLEPPYRGDSNEYTQHTIVNIKKKITLNYPKYDNVCSYEMFSKELKNEFEIAMMKAIGVGAIKVLLYF